MPSLYASNNSFCFVGALHGWWMGARDMSAQHTLGPWKFIGTDPAEGGDWFWINTQPNPAMRGFTKNIGVVNGSQSDPEQLANARLIAAAPELLAALWAALSAANEMGLSSAYFPRPLIEAAIAKAVQP
jgi:hypothetical protein